ncbi:UNVERIFIED_CONTAM: hypothetical protein Slati_4247900 [Sesamum latifolium]|uniref:Uncharacterized protein n=1 Tax=Sesamum latifolium TaxID=2727402 RepID=A0AAW2TCM4_9LAMI
MGAAGAGNRRACYIQQPPLKLDLEEGTKPSLDNRDQKTEGGRCYVKMSASWNLLDTWVGKMKPDL